MARYFLQSPRFKILKSPFTVPHPLYSPTSGLTVHFLCHFSSRYETMTNHLDCYPFNWPPHFQYFSFSNYSWILDPQRTYFYNLWQRHPKFEAPNTKINWWLIVLHKFKCPYSSTVIFKNTWNWKGSIWNIGSSMLPFVWSFYSLAQNLQWVSNANQWCASSLWCSKP